MCLSSYVVYAIADGNRNQTIFGTVQKSLNPGQCPGQVYVAPTALN